MKRNCLSALAIGLMLCLVPSAAQAQRTNNANNHRGNDQINEGASIRFQSVGGNTWEFFRVNEDAPLGRNDPRAERGLDPGFGGATIDGRDVFGGRKVIVLSG